MTPVSTEPQTASQAEITPAPPVTAPSTAGMTTKVVKGSLWTLAGQVAPLAVSLITTPFVIRMLGAESYGVYVLIGLIPTYLWFADFGMGLASTKYACEAYSEADPRREARIVRTAALIALCSSLPIAFALFAASPYIISLFNVPDTLRGSASLALKFASLTFVFTLLSSILNTPQLARLRMDLNTLVTSGGRILGIVAAPFAIYISGFAGAVFVLMLASILTAAAHFLVSWRLNRNLFEFTIERSMVRPLLKFGGAMVGAGVAAVLLVNGEKGILSAAVSPVALAHYWVAFSLASMVTLFSSAMIQSLLPAFSQLQSASSNAALNALYSRCIRLSLIWLIPALVFFAMIAKPFFGIWAGSEFAAESTLPFYILLAGIAFNILAYVPNAAILAAGRTGVLAKLYWLELVIYAVVVWFLAFHFGAVGAAVAWSLRVAADAVVQFALARRVAGVRSNVNRLISLGFASVIMLVPGVMSLYLGTLSLVVVLLAVGCLSLYSFLVLKTTLEEEEFLWLSARVGGRLAWIRS